MNILAVRPITVASDSLQNGALFFDETTQQVIFGDSRFAVGADQLVQVSSSLLERVMNVRDAELSADVQELTTTRRFAVAATQSYDGAADVPGPQILRAVTLRAPEFVITFRRADAQLYLCCIDTQKHAEMRLPEAIYCAIALRGEKCFRIITLTATRFPSGYYGARSSVVSGHLSLIEVPEALFSTERDSNDAAAIKQNQTRLDESDGANRNVPEPLNALCVQTHEVGANACKKEEETAESEERVETDARMVQTLFTHYIAELQGNCRPQVLSEITHLIEVLRK